MLIFIFYIFGKILYMLVYHQKVPTNSCVLFPSEKTAVVRFCHKLAKVASECPAILDPLFPRAQYLLLFPTHMDPSSSGRGGCWY